MKTFDGREKSVLRVAARPLLPESTVKRVKSPYPSTQDPSYEAALREEVAAIANDPADPAAHLFDRTTVKQALDRSLGNVSVLTERADLERVRSLSTWFKEYDVALAA